MIARVRELTAGCNTVHGGNRRPGREFTVDPAEIAAWTERNETAIEANRQRPTRERLQDSCVTRYGGEFA